MVIQNYQNSQDISASFMKTIQKPLTGLSAQALEKRGILKAAQKHGWHDDPESMIYWRYLIVDPFSGAKAWRFKAQPGNSGMKYRWLSTDPQIANNRTAKQKPDDLHYYAPQGLAALKAAVQEAGGVLHIANGEPSTLVMLSAGFENVMNWMGETSVPPNLPIVLHSMNVTRLIYWPDNDTVGRSAAAKVKRLCKDAGIGFEARHHGIDADKADLNDLWIQVGFDHHEFRRRLESAQPAQLPELYTRPAFDFERVYEPDDDSHKERLIRDVEAYIHRHEEGRVQQRGDWLNHCSLLRPDDLQPSAGFNIRTGVYKDFGGSGTVMSVWEFAKALGFRLEDYRPERKPRKPIRPTTTKPAQASKASNLPAPETAPGILLDTLLKDPKISSRFWTAPNWRKQHRLLTIVGPIHMAQIVARTRDALAQGALSETFSPSEFANAVGISKGHVYKYLFPMRDILWTHDGKSYTIMQEPDMARLMEQFVIPVLQMRHFHDHYCPIAPEVAAAVMLDDEALEYHITQAEAAKHISGAGNDEMRAYLKALRALSAEPIDYDMPDPWLHLTLYRKSLVVNVAAAYYAKFETRIENNIQARQEDHEARVYGAQNAFIAEQTGLNIATVRGMTKQLKDAGVLIGHYNMAHAEFTFADPLLNCTKAEMRRKISGLPAEYSGRLISVTCETNGIRQTFIITKGISDYVLDKIACADRVIFRIQQAIAYLPGWQSIEAILGAPSKEVADDKHTDNDDAEIQQVDEAEPPASTSADEPTNKHPWAKSAEKTLTKRLKANPKTQAYSAKWLLKQMWIGYRSNPPESIKVQYARALGIDPTRKPPPALAFDNIPF